MPPKLTRVHQPPNGLSGSPVKTSPSVAPGGQQTVHKCVMCEGVMESKQALQDHFRLHANGTIDMKGRRIKPAAAVVSTAAVDPPTKQTKNLVACPKPANLVPCPKPREDGRWQGKNAPTSHPSKISCDVCQEVFETVTIAIQHKFRKHPNSNVKYYCGFCGKQYPLEICKINHIKADHQKEKRSNKLYKCKDCSAEFFMEEAIKYHIRSTHQRVTALINPVATLGPSKKIKMNISGEPSSVYYCHLCGQEYMVKFNLQKHLEANHTVQVGLILIGVRNNNNNLVLNRSGMRRPSS